MSIVLGLGAGVAGTLAMTGWQELSAKLMSSDEDDSSPTPADPWDEAPVPAQVARKIARLAGVDPSPKRIPLLTNLMHWSYGTGWGALYGAAARRYSAHAVSGLAFGAGVWAMSYAQLVPMRLYEPPWTYSPSQLALDLSYHLVYGAGTQAAYALGTRALD
jgi:hypothetical protein